MVSAAAVVNTPVMESVINSSVFGAVLLIGLLVSRQLLVTRSGARYEFATRALSIAIVPLLVYFVVILGFKIAELVA